MDSTFPSFAMQYGRDSCELCLVYGIPILLSKKVYQFTKGVLYTCALPSSSSTHFVELSCLGAGLPPF